MTVDPLYQLGDWRKRVISPERFSSIVGQPPLRAAASEDQLAAVRYCDDFYEPIDASVVLDNLQPRSRV